MKSAPVSIYVYNHQSCEAKFNIFTLWLNICR